MLIAILVLSIITLILAAIAVTAASAALLVCLANASDLTDIGEHLGRIEQQTSKLNAIQFGPCDDPDCPTCNPIEEGEEWKRGHRHDD